MLGTASPTASSVQQAQPYLKLAQSRRSVPRTKPPLRVCQCSPVLPSLLIGCSPSAGQPRKILATCCTRTSVNSALVTDRPTAQHHKHLPCGYSFHLPTGLCFTQILNAIGLEARNQDCAWPVVADKVRPTDLGPDPTQDTRHPLAKVRRRSQCAEATSRGKREEDPHMHLRSTWPIWGLGSQIYLSASSKAQCKGSEQQIIAEGVVQDCASAASRLCKSVKHQSALEGLRGSLTAPCG